MALADLVCWALKCIVVAALMQAAVSPARCKCAAWCDFVYNKDEMVSAIKH